MIQFQESITAVPPQRTLALPGLRLHEVHYASGTEIEAHAHARANLSIVLGRRVRGVDRW